MSISSFKKIFHSMAAAVFLLHATSFTGGATPSFSSSPLSWLSGDTSQRTVAITGLADAGADSLSVSMTAVGQHFILRGEWDYPDEYIIQITPSGPNLDEEDISDCTFIEVCHDSGTTLCSGTVTLTHYGDDYSDGPLPEGMYGPSGDRNYVLKTTFLSADGTASRSNVGYYDGLGLLRQKVAVCGSPATVLDGTSVIHKSIVTPVVYDSMLRPDAVTYLPYATDGRVSASDDADPAGCQEQWAAAQQAFYASPLLSGLAQSDSRPFAVKAYETSPVGRPVSVQREGASWSSHAAVLAYGVVTPADSVMRFRYCPGILPTARLSQWPEASVGWEETMDDDGHKVRTYTDAAGRTVLIRRYAQKGSGSVTGGISAAAAETYFIYDLRDSLVCVLQPEGTAALKLRSVKDLPLSELAAAASSATNADIFSMQCFGRRFDAWGNVTESHAPGAGTTACTYDSRLRLETEQSPQMRAAGTMKEYVYDNYDRVTAERLVSCSVQRTVLRTLRTCSYYPFCTEYGYPSDCGACGGRLRTETLRVAPTASGSTGSSEAEGYALTRTYKYDSKGRVAQVFESDTEGWTGYVATTYDFVGNVLSVTESRGNADEGIDAATIVTAYTYDDRGRRLTCSRNADGEPLAAVHYGYDPLGRLRSRFFSYPWDTSDTLASELISYDIHGWRTGSTAHTTEDSIDNCGTQDIPVFSQTLRYADTASPEAAPLYNGSISEASSTQGISQQQTYAYSYDGMGMLRDARHFAGTLSSSSAEVLTDTEKGIRHDRNGNVTQLDRYVADGSLRRLSFDHNGNRMVQLTDSLENGATIESYLCSYDAGGNLVSDGRKGLQFTYNILNLPSVVTHSDGDVDRTVTYCYLSDGTKVSALTSGGSGRRYRGSFVYDADNVLTSFVWDEGRVFVNAVVDVDSLQALTGEEIAVVDTAVFTPFRDLWYVRDHLGNTRAVVDISSDLVSPTVVETCDYLPFGTPAGAGSSTASDFDNLWRYAGKEEQRFAGTSPAQAIDLALIDFGARAYDPFSARWTTPDPLAHRTHSVTPYAYCGNNPINYLDPDGRDWYRNEEGIITWTNYTSQEEMIQNKTSGTYLGQRVVVFNGSYSETLGEGGNIYGNGAVTASVDVYGNRGADDIGHYTGFSMTSNFEKFGAIADGEYNVTYNPSKKTRTGEAKIPKYYAVNDGDVVECVNGVNPSPQEYNPCNATQKNQIYVHRTNKGGGAGDKPQSHTCVSSGCLLIGDKDWIPFYNQIGQNGFKLLLIRK